MEVVRKVRILLTQVYYLRKDKNDVLDMIRNGGRSALVGYAFRDSVIETCNGNVHVGLCSLEVHSN